MKKSQQSIPYQSNGDSLLVSHFDKKKAGKETITVLTTVNTSVTVTKNQRVKPNVHSFYDHTKGGVDMVDLVTTPNTTKMENRRWPINVFDLVRNNAKIILARSSNPATPSSISHTLWESYLYYLICNTAIKTSLTSLPFLFTNCAKFWVFN